MPRRHFTARHQSENSSAKPHLLASSYWSLDIQVTINSQLESFTDCRNFHFTRNSTQYTFKFSILSLIKSGYKCTYTIFNEYACKTCRVCTMLRTIAYLLSYHMSFCTFYIFNFSFLFKKFTKYYQWGLLGSSGSNLHTLKFSLCWYVLIVYR